MRLHCIDGERMLEGPDFYRTARAIARSHHERWNGSGYPDGLRAEAIPLAARIVAVADVFDAMTTRRVYRQERTEEAAAMEIVAASGTLFDPAVVAAFEALRRDGSLPRRPVMSPAPR